MLRDGKDVRDMKFKIHNNINDDSLIIEGKSIEEMQKKAKKELEKRGWIERECWSEVIEL